jgi:hypothetical protein
MIPLVAHIPTPAAAPSDETTLISRYISRFVGWPRATAPLKLECTIGCQGRANSSVLGRSRDAAHDRHYRQRPIAHSEFRFLALAALGKSASRRSRRFGYPIRTGRVAAAPHPGKAAMSNSCSRRPCCACGRSETSKSRACALASSRLRRPCSRSTASPRCCWHRLDATPGMTCSKRLVLPGYSDDEIDGHECRSGQRSSQEPQFAEFKDPPQWRRPEWCCRAQGRSGAYRV